MLVVLSTDVDSPKPLFPCSVCGKETKEHHAKKNGKEIVARSRICSSASCRTVVVCDVATGEPITR